MVNVTSTTPTLLDRDKHDHSDPVDAASSEAPASEQKPRKNGTLIDAAVSYVKKLKKKEIDHEHSRRDISFLAVAGIYLLSVEADKDAELKNSIIAESKIKTRGGNLSADFFVRAVLAISDFELKRSTRWDWTRGVEALKISKVDANSQAVVDWFKEEEEFEDYEGGATGFIKAHAVVKRANKGKAKSPAVQRRLANQKSNRDEAWQSFVNPRLERPLGRIELGDRAASIPNGFILQLCNVEDGAMTMLDASLVNDKLLRTLIPKKQK
ncbi:hypothetical protein [Methylorubrum extorquens]|nr:hypothetical protein [Methylorubrum extorquens]